MLNALPLLVYVMPFQKRRKRRNTKDMKLFLLQKPYHFHNTHNITIIWNTKCVECKGNERDRDREKRGLKIYNELCLSSANIDSVTIYDFRFFVSHHICIVWVFVHVCLCSVCYVYVWPKSIRAFDHLHIVYIL